MTSFGSVALLVPCSPPPEQVRIPTEHASGVTEAHDAARRAAITPEVKLLRVLKGELDRRALQTALGLKDAEHFRRAYLQPVLKAGLVEMTIPDRPRSSKQRYRLTRKGLSFLERIRGKP
jgi:hypothetical protein